uniref:Uncharacterized protein n=1 Tax=Lepeophtheirus salmonis TaxID=72036 RepID=A0A0K2UF56_LEPSM
MKFIKLVGLLKIKIY